MDPITTLNTICIISKDLKETYVILEHIIFGIGVPLNSLGLWCIYQDKTTRIKWILFNCQIWYFMCDIIFSVMSLPQFLIPFVAVRPLGLFAYIGIPSTLQLYIGASTFGLMGASTLHLFFHRHPTIVSKLHPRAFNPSVRVLLTLLFYLYFGSVGFICFLVVSTNKVKGLTEYAQSYECLYTELFLSDTVIASPEYITFFIVYAIIYVFLWVSSIIFLVADSFYAINAEHRTLSHLTRAQIRRSLRNIVLQISTSLMFLIVPIIAIGIQIIIKSYNQLVPCVFICILSFHASMGTIAGICLNKQYRWSLFRVCKVEDKTFTSNVTTVAKSHAA